VSGVPGTGKTATVNEVVRMLRESQTEGDLPDFKLIQVIQSHLDKPLFIFFQNKRGGYLQNGCSGNEEFIETKKGKDFLLRKKDNLNNWNSFRLTE